VPDNHWKYGADLPYLKSLLEYWRDGYDWRQHEARLNSLNQYKVKLAGIDVQFIREEGKGPAPMPLLLSHGWPGSVYEFHKILPMLTDPARFGGDAADAFTVIAPSLPGYAFSFAPNQPRFSVEQIADVFAELMTSVLGYKRFGAQGGDWGGFVTSRLGYAYPERLIGIHLNYLSLRRDAPPPENPTEDEKRYLAEQAHWMKEEVGYIWIQGTKPQTLAYALTDSPAGLAAWIVEKFHAWCDCDGDVEKKFTKDELLTNIMVYWATQTAASSTRIYFENRVAPPNPAKVTVPTACALFPKEITVPPRKWVEARYNLTRWTEMPRGGHFAAMEQPELLVTDIREFFRTLR